MSLFDRKSPEEKARDERRKVSAKRRKERKHALQRTAAWRAMVRNSGLDAMRYKEHKSQTFFALLRMV